MKHFRLALAATMLVGFAQGAEARGWFSRGGSKVLIRISVRSSPAAGLPSTRLAPEPPRADDWSRLRNATPVQHAAQAAPDPAPVGSIAPHAEPAAVTEKEFCPTQSFAGHPAVMCLLN